MLDRRRNREHHGPGGHDVGRQGERRQAGKRDASEQRVSAPHEDAEHEQRFAEAEVERGEQPEVAARKYPERAEDAERDARGACATQALFEKNRGEERGERRIRRHDERRAACFDKLQARAEEHVVDADAEDAESDDQPSRAAMVAACGARAAEAARGG